ncbi:MAG TPA: adenylate/guanylate cyclase domain-containing protein, partial [Gaiellaceae bacterium]|nr:adenylate/guanylate cyclase domain-containing protein [Gaiellaceae bacterium]
MAVCAGCGEENPDGAKFCMSCGAAQAAPACPSCGEENPPKAKFCLDCGTPLASVAPPPPSPAAPPVVGEERKLDTLVFVDLVGSTALAESLDPEDVLSLLELYYTRLRAELERHGGTVEKYIGDAIVTHFGVPVGHEDDPERAVRAALAILDTVEALNAEDPIRQIQVRIGIHTGEVIVRHGNRAEEGKGLAWGDALNTAARIESAAPAMGILVGEETFRASRHAIEYREHEPIEAKGKAEPVRVWEVVGVREAAARGRGRDAPLLGRDAELARLVAVWEQVCTEGRPALATVLGEPGVGKSRLVDELAGRISDRGTVLWGRCLAYGEGITYWPLAEALADVSPAGDTDDGAAIARSLAAVVREEAITKGELHWGIRRLLELEASAAPTVLVVEDVHWAEPTLLDLLASLDGLDAPLLVVTTSRDDGAAGPGATVVALEPLS